MPDPLMVSWSASRKRALDRLLEVLAAGGVVALPTETVYGLAASVEGEASRCRLDRLKGRSDPKPITLAFRDRQQAESRGLRFCAAARSLSERYWPGPLTMVVPDASGIETGARVPAGDAVRTALEAWGRPLLLTSANRTGEHPCVDAPSVARLFGPGVDLILDDGPAPIKQASAVVRLVGGGLEVLREGLLTGDMIRGYAGTWVLLVCTGNTCRSPMAQAILTGLLCRALQVPPEGLASRGFEIHSAGTAAVAGGHPSPEAVAVMESRGWPLTARHESRPLDAESVRRATHIIAMTRAHRQAIAERFPEVATRTRLVHGHGNDVADPIGGSVVRYAACADELETHLASVAQELLAPYRP